MRRLLRDNRGTSAVEFALLAPMLTLLLLGTADVGLAYKAKQQATVIAGAAAQWGGGNYYYQGCQQQSGVPCDDRPLSWGEGVESAMQAQFNDPTIRIDRSDEVCACPNEAGTAIMTGDFGGSGNVSCSGVCPDGSPPGHYFVVSAAIHYKPIGPYSLVGERDLSGEAVGRVD